MWDQIVGVWLILAALLILAWAGLRELEKRRDWDDHVDDALKLAMHPATRDRPLYDVIAAHMAKDLDAELEQLLRDGGAS